MCGFQRVVFGVCIIALWLLTAAIYALTLYFAYQTNSFWALLASIFLPYLIDFYWIWHIWSVTGIFFNLITLLWIGWFGLVAAMTLFTLHADS